MGRKQKMTPLADADIPSFVALGRQVTASAALTPEQEAVRRRVLEASQVPLSDPKSASSSAG
jgi:hypothetical protein